MSSPVRRKRRMTLAAEFRKSVKAGPRVWLITAAVFTGVLGLPLLGRLMSLLATVALGIGLLFIAPIIISAVAGVVVAYLRQKVVVSVFTASGAAATAPERMRTAVEPEPRRIRQAEVIEVKTVEAP